ncbi:AIPR family protein [Variovorax boronicumulans]|uniref:AIPR family protein n=1 Tax=Variovorax boronicumulans TaxID=436515 RepID=UPI00278B17CC|nr:AIPR family protein [Variovorax boronicumulans]MDQ0045034.1 hypothetical protein [Variovorax boronicumulans]
MTDEDFYEELRQIVERRAASTHLVDTIAFAEEVAERLEEDPAFGEYVPAEFSGASKRNKQFRIHGFTRLDESDGSIGLVVAKWDDADSPETLTSGNVTQLSGFLEAFAQESIKEDLCEKMTEANGAYELALLLKNALGKINRIRLHIFSNQPLSQRFKEQICEPIGDIVIERHVWDLQRLRAIYESSREREVIELNMSEFESEGIECMEAARTSELQSYLCILSGDTLANMFERYGSRLLEGNVRSFLGMKGGVNKGIRKTVLDSPELFFAYNNGIAATASAVERKVIDGRQVITNLVDLQIVNGGQTTASILNARKKDKLSLAGVSVAMKLTVIEGIEANALIPKIAEFANTQNKIAVADFFANHPFHRKMEEISRRLVTPASASSRVRSKWFYERSRGQYQNERLYLSEAKKNSFDLEYPSNQVVNKTDLAKYDGVFEERPHWVSLGSQKNFIKFASTFESKNPDTSPVEHWATISPKYADAYYQRIAATAILWKNTEGIVSSGRGEWYKGDFRAQIVAYALSLLFHSIRKSGFDLNALSIWNLQSVPEELSACIRNAAELAQVAILSPPTGMTNIGEWTKKDTCWEKAKLADLVIPTDASWIVSREDARSSSTDARKQGAQDDAIALQQQLLQMVQEGYWVSLLRWPMLSTAISESQRSLVIKASTMQGFMRIATEKDWRRLLEVRDACDEAGFRRE